VGEEALVAGVGYGLCDCVPVDFLGVVDLIASGIAAGVEVADEGDVFGDGADEIAFHNLHVIDVVEQFDSRRADALHQLDSPCAVVGHVVLVVHLAVEEFQVYGDAFFFRVGLDFIEPDGAVGQAFAIRQAFAIAGKDNHVRGFGGGGKSDVVLQAFENFVVVIEAIEADGNRVGRGARGHGRNQPVLLHRGVLIRRNQIDPFEADADGFFAKPIEIEPFLIGPQRDTLLQTASQRRGERGPGECRNAGCGGRLEGGSSIHRPNRIRTITSFFPLFVWTFIELQTLTGYYRAGHLLVMTLKEALYSLATRPVDLLVRRGNWKAAFFSSLIRGIIFFLANLRSGWHAAVGAMLAEWTYRALTSGFYGAITQTLGETEPEWQGAVAAMVLLPLSSHTLEFLVHWLRHTPHLKASIISSMSFTVISTLFNFCAMRRGTMVVGENCRTLGQDMKAMPRSDWRISCGDPALGCEVAAGQRGLKTLHLTNCWHASSGGVGTFYKALFEAAEREGHFMRLVVPGEKTQVEEVGRFGRIYHIEAPRAPLNRDYRLVLPHRFLFRGTALQNIVNEEKQEKPDLIEASDKYSMLYLAGLLRTGRLPGVKLRPTVVGTSHERMDENVAAYLTRGEAGRKFCEWYMKWVYFPMFHHHITVSEHTAAELVRASHGHKVRRGIWVAPMGVDSDRFTPERKSAAGRERLIGLCGGSPDVTILLYAGRLAPEKNLGLLIETAARLDPARYRLAIAGSGILLESLRQDCAARGLNHVAFLGHVADRELLADCFANADVFVHPNPREPFGITPLEAMASGLALVAPNAGGVTAYANESNCRLADPSPEAFARAIGDVSAGSNRRVAARQTALDHSWSRVTRRYLQLYRELHALTQGQQITETIKAHTYSTPGDLPNRELIGR